MSERDTKESGPFLWLFNERNLIYLCPYSGLLRVRNRKKVSFVKKVTCANKKVRSFRQLRRQRKTDMISVNYGVNRVKRTRVTKTQWIIVVNIWSAMKGKNQTQGKPKRVRTRKCQTCTIVHLSVVSGYVSSDETKSRTTLWKYRRTWFIKKDQLYDKFAKRISPRRRARVFLEYLNIFSTLLTPWHSTPFISGLWANLATVGKLPAPLQKLFITQSLLTQYRSTLSPFARQNRRTVIESARERSQKTKILSVVRTYTR